MPAQAACGRDTHTFSLSLTHTHTSSSRGGGGAAARCVEGVSMARPGLQPARSLRPAVEESAGECQETRSRTMEESGGRG